MRNDLAVNFETFYFFNLLDKIEKTGRNTYDDTQLNYLEKFLDYLSESDTASSSIEKLIRFKSTSDLSIFFSDILEHIKKMKPENAIEKIDTYSLDFLEIFKVLIKDEEWKSHFKELGIAETEVEDSSEKELSEELSFKEYCDFVIDSKLKSYIPKIPSEQQPLFNEFLETTLKDPSLADKLQQKIQNEKVTKFVELNAALFDGQTKTRNLENYIQNFNSDIEKWSLLFKEIFEENTNELKELLFPQVVEEREEEYEGVEELINETEEESLKTDEIESSATDIDNLVDRMEGIQKSQETHKFSDEEKNRRKLLKDYIISEVESYKEELFSSLRKLSDEANDIQSENKLLEDLKYFKDLGQIHSYAGIELVGGDLLKLFESVFRNDQSVSPQMLKNVENIFQILPDYVDSSISSESENHISDIRNELKNLSSIIGDEEQISLEHKTTLKETFNEILDRKIKIIRGKFDRQSIQLWNENDLSELSSTLDNIFFWSNILKLNHVVNAINLLKQLLLTPIREKLTPQNIKSITRFIDFMVKEYSNTDTELWISATDNLREILSDFENVSISDAIVAFEEVTKKQIYLLLKKIEQSQVSSIEVFAEALPDFFGKLGINASLIKNQELKKSTSIILDKLDEVLPYFSALESNEKERLKPYLEELLVQFDGVMIKPVNFDRLSNYFTDLQNQLSESKDEVITKTEPEAETKDKYDTITDADIQIAFVEEAKKYVENIQNNISKLEIEDNKDLWNEIGVVLHTLKGSAQMVGKTGIAQLTKTFEELTNLVIEGKIPKNEETFKLMKNAAESIYRTIDDPAHFSEELNEQFSNYSKSFTEEKPAEKSKQVSKDTAFLSEDELVHEEESSEIIELTEHDPELLEIFNDEVSNNIKLVDQNLDSFEKFAYDKGMMQDVDRAVHEICSAAKMLGLVEIGDLSEKLEKIVDLIYQQKITNIKEVIPLLRKGMLVIRELTLHSKIEQDFYEEVEEEIELILEGITQPGQAAKTMEKPVAQEGKPEGITNQVWEAFFQEAAELCEDINYLILELEKNPENKELKHHLMRSIHTLKGSAAMVYAHKIETLVHLSEEVFEKYSKDNLPLTTDVFDVLLQVLDEVNYILTALKTFKQEDTQNYEEINKKLTQIIETEEKTEIDKDTKVSEPQKAEPPVKKIEKEQPRKVTQTEQTYIRLNINQMNHLLNLAAELVISHTQFKNQLDGLKNISPAMDMELKLFDETKEHLDSILKLEQKIQETLSSIQDVQPGVQESVKNQLVNIQKILGKFQAFQSEIDTFSHSLKSSSLTYDENIQKLNKLSNELLDEIIQARLVPIQLLFKRFQRPIRDMSHQIGKKIKLVIKGEDTELDRSLVEELYNPLIHIIRNAIDHGIETEKERKENKKDPEGLLEIRAFRDRNQVTIEIKDDGKGIDLDTVKKSALEKELVSPNEIENMTEDEVLELLFYPGFSTMAEVTLVSGRGVGLDAVKSDIEKIKGDIRIYSENGQGTTVVIRVPISLSVIQSMLVNVSDHTYSIPLSQVEETLNIEPKDFIKKKEDFFLLYKTKEIPLVLLSKLLGLRDSKASEASMKNKKPVIITFDRGNYVALLVDDIIRREEILIKSLGPTLKRLKYFTGGSIMAEGRVVLVIDVPQIIQETLKAKPDTVYNEPVVSPRPKRDTKRISLKKKKDTQKIIEDRKPSILVVDDSLSIRKYLNGILTKKGFSISTARNGLEALDLLKDKKFDLIITDLEMPQVSGYELIETIRLDEQHNDTPIIVLTGRASEDFKNLTTELGADAYIIKPFKDQELFDEIENHIRYNK